MKTNLWGDQFLLTILDGLLIVLADDVYDVVRGKGGSAQRSLVLGRQSKEKGLTSSPRLLCRHRIPFIRDLEEGRYRPASKFRVPLLRYEIVATVRVDLVELLQFGDILEVLLLVGLDCWSE